MAFGLTDEQRALVEEARRVARQALVPLADRGEPHRVNRPLVRALGEGDLLGRIFPASGEVSAMTLCLLREALARECVEAETALALQGLGGYPILQSGSPDLVERYVRPVAAGRAVAAFALTESEHGSDAAHLELRADREGDGFTLYGEKAYISNAPEADVYTVFARTTPESGAKGVTAFVVDRAVPGLSGEPIELMADHAVGRLRFNAVPVPATNVLGEVDGGFRVAMRTLDLFRPSVGGFAVGMAWAALDAATSHAAGRAAFGRPIREFQAVSHPLAEMATRAEAARLMVYAAAAAYDRGAPDITRRSAMAKLFATETAQWVVDAAVQIHGARALQRGHLLEKLYREVRAPRIYEGTTEIQREVIARDLFR